MNTYHTKFHRFLCNTVGNRLTTVGNRLTESSTVAFIAQKY